jgi:predicted methyltransferase MtxX (methanogen marker protein 4)
MAAKSVAKKVSPIVDVEDDSARGPAPEDADSILDKALGLMRHDLSSMEDGVRIDSSRAWTLSNYVRALGAIAKSRSGGKTGALGRAKVDDLIEEALKIPELRQALRDQDE